jgi:hypothetical protein
MASPSFGGTAGSGGAAIVESQRPSRFIASSLEITLREGRHGPCSSPWSSTAKLTGGMRMLIEKALTDVTTPPPVNAGATYVGTEIQVPVFVDSSTNKPFAPPFLIPKGIWTVVFTVETQGWVFDSVIYFKYGCTPPDDCTALPSGVQLVDNSNVPGGTTWTTIFDTSGVTFVNMMGSTISLRPESEPFLSDSVISGDPTIAVVKEPIDG